jgi:hypothetical protein
MLFKKPLSGKVIEAYIVGNTENEFLIKMSESFPFIPGTHKHFFVNIEVLMKKWRHGKDAVQINIF